MRNFLLSIAATVACGASAAFAAPVNLSPFLKLDLNGDSGGGPGPTQTDLGYTGFSLANSPAGSTLTTTVGVYGVSLTRSPLSTNFFSRNRGPFTPGTVSPLYQDFIAVARDAAQGIGSNYLQIQISNLAPNTTYEFTGFGNDYFSNGTGTGNRELFSVTAPTGYTPGSTPPAFNGATPEWTGNPTTEYQYSASFNVTSDAGGVITVYAWGDTASFSNQTATIVNGFALGTIVPEPGTITVISLGAAGLLIRRRPN